MDLCQEKYFYDAFPPKQLIKFVLRSAVWSFIHFNNFNSFDCSLSGSFNFFTYVSSRQRLGIVGRNIICAQRTRHQPICDKKLNDVHSFANFDSEICLANASIRTFKCKLPCQRLRFDLWLHNPRALEDLNYTSILAIDRAILAVSWSMSTSTPQWCTGRALERPIGFENLFAFDHDYQHN